jgi:hypothetical protein
MPSATRSLVEILHAMMSAPGYAEDNDGYALAPDIARDSRRPVRPVRLALLIGEQMGRFSSRPHPTEREPTSPFRPMAEYKAVGT